jgi:hypothetical protein
MAGIGIQGNKITKITKWAYASWTHVCAGFWLIRMVCSDTAYA